MATQLNELYLRNVETVAGLVKEGSGGAAAAAAAAAAASPHSKWLMGGLAVGAAGLSYGVSKLQQAARKASSYRDMMALNPDLQDMQREDPRRFHAYYESLHRLAPAFGEDPVVAGSLMRRMASSPESAGAILQQTVRQPDMPRSSSPVSIETALGPFKLKHNV